MSTAAQNIPVFLRKSPLCRNHFFVWLKTENFSNACGTSTLKSLPSRVFAAPHVHLRLRKRLSRCTLDCGFKTSESPALRGFVGGLRALATAALYLVLLSNGLHHSENLPVKFGFSPQIVPANIVKKLPSQRCFKPLFNSSHKRPTFVFTGESGYTLGFRRKIAHSGLHAETGGVLDGGGITTLRLFCTFRKPCVAGYQNGILCRFGILAGRCSRRTQKAFGTAMRLCASLSRGVAAPLGCVICLQLGDVAVFSLCAQYFLNVRGGGGITTLGAFHTFRKPCVAGV